MNLLLINYEFPPIGGGAATATWNTAHELAKQGHQVTVLTSCFQELRGWSEEQGVFIYRCLAFRHQVSRSSLFEQFSFVLSAMMVLPRLLKKQNIQGIIVYFSIPCGPLGLWAKLLYKTPYIVSLRGGDVPGLEPRIMWIHRILQPLRRVILKQAIAIVANSIGLQQVAQKADPFQTQIIANGVDTHFFFPIPHENPIFQFLFVGRFQEQKNLFFLLKQLKKLRDTTTLAFCCHLVGDGYQKTALQAYAQQLQLDDVLIWHGWLDKTILRACYQQADCLLSFSLYEGMPNVLLEAMASGLAIVASQVTGHESVVRHGETGYLLALQNNDEIQTTLKYLITNRQQTKVLGDAGRQWVMEHFSWEQVAKQYVQLFVNKS
ncbi:glycosyltransferase family 4 protein [Beggiatoa leptomitoformis]|uniref:Glycosyltransferase n=1 Tax=Beggiatoa leptomitoformis TaxID=288004 RepID=A0A2N9YHR7_9GAMM|nr:glycosyltransferase family 4 protein [Beggiatoa leptomitoformis]ALG67820.1 glycosyltransferase [Beggiatoa leptomitoformis]AUI69925.1 glycosyltransferase [Beggiatoa leptomitoformis]